MTELIPAALLAQLTTINESAMQETLTINDTTLVPDGAGGWTETPTTRNVPGLFWSVSGDEAGAEQVRAMGKHRAEIPKTTAAVNATARITRANGEVYAIKYVFPLDTFPTARRFGLEEA